MPEFRDFPPPFQSLGRKLSKSYVSRMRGISLFLYFLLLCNVKFSFQMISQMRITSSSLCRKLMGYDHSIRCRRGERGEKDLIWQRSLLLQLLLPVVLLSPLSLSPTLGALLDSKPAFPPFSVKIPNASRFQNMAKYDLVYNRIPDFHPDIRLFA